MPVLLRTTILAETLVVTPCALPRPGVERQGPCSLDNLPECVPVVPTVSLQIDLVFFDLLRSLERSLTHDPHYSNGLLYNARHRSQNLTPLAPTRQHAVLHPSD